MNMIQKILLPLGVIFLLITGCKTAKPENVQNMQAHELEGLWEVNYIMNMPKAVDELYPKMKPSIEFHMADSRVSGNAGCNQYTGAVQVEGNQIRWPEAGFALTRKMCPDMSGEELYLNTLKKVNQYSVSEDGNTLNMIMGDMAIMRFTRKPL